MVADGEMPQTRVFLRVCGIHLGRIPTITAATRVSLRRYCVLGGLGQLGKGFRFLHGQLGQDLAIKIDA